MWRVGFLRRCIEMQACALGLLHPLLHQTPYLDVISLNLNWKSVNLRVCGIERRTGAGDWPAKASTILERSAGLVVRLSEVAEGSGSHDKRAINVSYGRAATQSKAQFQFGPDQMQYALNTRLAANCQAPQNRTPE